MLNLSEGIICRLIIFILVLTDIDECLPNNGGCSHNCTNTAGSYYCECAAGYILHPNNLDCIESGCIFDCTRITI